MYPREKKGKKKQSVMDFTSFLLSFQPLQAGNIFSPFYFIFFHVLRCWHVFDMEEKIS